MTRLSKAAYHFRNWGIVYVIVSYILLVVLDLNWLHTQIDPGVIMVFVGSFWLVLTYILTELDLRQHKREDVSD